MTTMHQARYLRIVLPFIGAVLAVGRIDAGERCCAHCGCSGGSQKVCRLVCEEKKVQVTCWGCAQEDFCVPSPSKPGCQHCEYVCGESSDPKAPCVQPKKFVWTDWIPGCGARIHTKQKLMKKTITKTVPSYKWVVEDLCEACQNLCPVVDVPPGDAAPLPPDVDAKRIPAR